MRMNERNLAAAVLAEVKKSIVGKEGTLIKVLVAILARGHILLEDIPGVGKTTMALSFAKALDLRFSRMQFTPDVLPSDITGFSIYNKATGKLEYQPGAIFCNLFLADELNRATSRTQSASLLQTSLGSTEPLSPIIELQILPSAILYSMPPSLNPTQPSS